MLLAIVASTVLCIDLVRSLLQQRKDTNGADAEQLFHQ